MKLLHIAPIGHIAEGIGTVLTKISEEQLRQGIDVRIYSIYENKIYHDVDIKHIKSIDEFKESLVDFKPDIVIFHSLYHMQYLSMANFLQQKEIPYLIQMHGALSINNYKKNKFKKWLANLLFFNSFMKNARRIIYLNHGEYENCIVKKINPQFLIIPNGCDCISSFRERQIGEIINMVFVGRIDIHHKALDILADAIRCLKQKNYNQICLSIYGINNEKDMDALKKLYYGLEDIVHLCPGVYGEAKEKVLRDADMFVLVSRFEGMPMGVLEALSFGVPCFVTPGTNMAEYIAEYKAGWITSLDPEQIASDMISAVSCLKKSPSVYQRGSIELAKSLSWESIVSRSKQELMNIK